MQLSGSGLVAAVSELLTAVYSHTSIPNSMRLLLTGRSRFCKEEPAVSKALPAETNFPLDGT